MEPTMRMSNLSFLTSTGKVGIDIVGLNMIAASTATRRTWCLNVMELHLDHIPCFSNALIGWMSTGPTVNNILTPHSVKIARQGELWLTFIFFFFRLLINKLD
ncbi:unnamed protein product, partial [Discosporangium mesarthrocarpum]